MKAEGLLLEAGFPFLHLLLDFKKYLGLIILGAG
jgi:hypothetical protein